jgi:hypothetical protein
MALTAAFIEHHARASQTTKSVQVGLDQWQMQAWREQMRD